MYLYLDTTEDLNIGLYDENYKALKFLDIKSKKTSLILQSTLFELLKEKNLEVKDLQGIIYCAGPGSYTGMRVGQGFVDICQWQKIPVYSFYHFKVPKILNIQSGSWIASAFKGETFIYKWNGDENSTELVKDETLKLEELGDNIFTRGEMAGQEKIKSTQILIRENDSFLFKYIVENKIKEELFYYRPLEQEFKVPNA